MPWIEVELVCPSCRAKILILPEMGDRTPICTRCGETIFAIQIFRPSGFIYILSNPSMPGLLKIGYTERDVEDRAAEISAATGVPGPYLVEAFSPSENPTMDESKIHNLLNEFRAGSKEFFRVDIQDALDAVYKVCRRRPRYCRPGINYVIPDERVVYMHKEEQKKIVALLKLNYLNKQETNEANRLISMFTSIPVHNHGEIDDWIKKYSSFIRSVKGRRIQMGLEWKFD